MSAGCLHWLSANSCANLLSASANIPGNTWLIFSTLMRRGSQSHKKRLLNTWTAWPTLNRNGPISTLSTTLSWNSTGRSDLNICRSAGSVWKSFPSTFKSPLVSVLSTVTLSPTIAPNRLPDSLTPPFASSATKAPGAKSSSVLFRILTAPVRTVTPPVCTNLIYENHNKYIINFYTSWLIVCQLTCFLDNYYSFFYWLNMYCFSTVIWN